MFTAICIFISLLLKVPEMILSLIKNKKLLLNGILYIDCENTQ